MLVTWVTKKYKNGSDVKSMANAFGHFKDDPVLKIDETFHHSLNLCKEKCIFCFFHE